jgi:paraquat-inducible protein B
MSKKPSTTRIGAFVLGAIALAVVVIAVFGSGDLFKKKDQYVIYFRGSAAGLSRGSPVKLRGVEIGEVTEIRALFLADWEFCVEVKIEADSEAVDNLSGSQEDMPHSEEIGALIIRGLRAQLQTQSMVLGLKYVKLDLFPETPPILMGLQPEYIEIPSIPTTEEELVNKLRRSMEQLEQVPLAEISQAVLKMAGSIDRLANSEELTGAIVAFNETMDETRVLLRKMDTNLGPLVSDLSRASNALEATLVSADTLLVHINSVTGENQEQLYSTFAELSETAKSLRLLLDYLQRHPDAIMWGKD